MKKRRRTLEILLSDILQENNKNEDFLKSFLNSLEGKIYRGRATRIFDTSLQLSLLSDEELCLICRILYKLTRNTNIIPETFFLDREIRASEKVESIDIDQNALPNVEFKNFLHKEGEEEWLGYVSYKQIKDWFERGYLTYNLQTQRKSTILERQGTRYVLPTIHRKSLNNIAKQMVLGKFYTNAITLNITKNLKEDVIWDEENSTLIVPISPTTELAIIDGCHRILGMVKALGEKDIDNEICVIVKNLTVDEAQEFIYQEAQINKQNISALKNSSVRDPFMEMTKTIARMGSPKNNILYGKIGFLEGNMKEAYCIGERFATGLRDNFSDLYYEKDLGVEIAKYIVDFFNLMGKLCPDEFLGDVEELKHKYVTVYSNLYVGLLAYARKIYGELDWDERLKDMLEIMDWRVENPEWRSLGITLERLTVKTKEKIYSYFKNL